MALSDRKHDAQRCTRCSYCKFIPYENARHPDFMAGCPAVKRHGFHAYASGGKFNLTLSYLSGRTDITDGLLEAVYRCHMDGSCDVSCKAVQELEPLENIRELRAMCVEQGYGHPVHQMVIEGLRKEDNMMQAKKADRGNWLADLPAGTAPKDLTGDKAEVLFHAGCRYSFDEELHPTRAHGPLAPSRGRRRRWRHGTRRGLLWRAGIRAGLHQRVHEVLRAQPGSIQGGRCQDRRHSLRRLLPALQCRSTTRWAKRSPGVEVLHSPSSLHRLLAEGKIGFTKRGAAHRHLPRPLPPRPAGRALGALAG